jgi:hypothetical protein
VALHAACYMLQDRYLPLALGKHHSLVKKLKIEVAT